MVLAELAGVVAEIKQELGNRRGAGSQIRRAPGKLRRDHTSAERIHAGEEHVAPRRAALHGIVGGELPTLRTDTVDVGSFANPDALVVETHLHPADVVTHNEQNVRLL